MGQFLGVLLYLLPAASALCVVASWLAQRAADRRWARHTARAALVGLILCTGAGLYSYAGGTSSREYFNHHEFFHYYLGTKYAREVGYTRMYVAAIRAMEQQGVPPPQETRDLTTSKRRQWTKMAKHGKRVERRFSKDRWALFKQDVKFFHDAAPGRFPGMVKDRGYNGTPILTMVSGTIATLVPTSSATGMHALPFLDVALWLVAFVAVLWCYGLRTALLVSLVLCTQMVTSDNHLKAAFLRVDWVVAMLLSMCALRVRRPALAGALLGYAALLRIFPAVFAFGIAGRLAWGLVRHRRLERDGVRFLLAMAVTAVAGVLLSLIVVGPEVWTEFLTKIRSHHDLVTSWRIGFKYLLVPSGTNGERAAWLAEWSLLLFAGNAVVLALLVPLTEPLESDELLAFGFVAFFLMIGTAYYYYVVLLVPALWYASRLERTWAMVATLSLFAIAILGHALDRRFGLGWDLFLPLSAALLAHVVFVVAALLLPWWRRRSATPTADAVAVAPTPCQQEKSG